MTRKGSKGRIFLMSRRNRWLPCRTPGSGANLRYAVEVETDISRYAIGKAWDAIRPGEQSSRYFSLTKPALDAPIGTLTQMMLVPPRYAQICGNGSASP